MRLRDITESDSVLDEEPSFGSADPGATTAPGSTVPGLDMVRDRLDLLVDRLSTKMKFYDDRMDRLELAVRKLGGRGLRGER